MLTLHKLPFAAAFCLVPHIVTADDVFIDDVIVTGYGSGRICVGDACTDGETFADERGLIKFSSGTNAIDFNDTSGYLLPDRDWRIQANETSGGSAGEAFFIRDVTSSTNPFYVQGGAPSNALYIASDGDIGLGTSLPMEKLHVTGVTPNLRFEDVHDTTYTWDIGGNNTFFFIQDVTAGGGLPFIILPGAPASSQVIDSAGNVGLGTPHPNGKLHTYGDGHQIAYFESADNNAVQVRFRTDSENRRFLAVDSNDKVKTQMQFKDNSIVFLGETAAQEWLNVSASGITTAGPSCNPNPCDATFDPDAFEVPSIEDHAEYMWENQHLWAVGPTKPGEPFNLTQKAGGMLHELEVAHIYIEQLHARLEAHETQNAELKAQIKTLFAKLDLIVRE